MAVSRHELAKLQAQSLESGARFIKDYLSRGEYRKAAEEVDRMRDGMNDLYRSLRRLDPRVRER